MPYYEWNTLFVDNELTVLVEVQKKATSVTVYLFSAPLDGRSCAWGPNQSSLMLLCDLGVDTRVSVYLFSVCAI